MSHAYIPGVIQRGASRSSPRHMEWVRFLTPPKRHHPHSVLFKDNKMVATSVVSPAASKVLRQVDVATADIVSVRSVGVNLYFIIYSAGIDSDVTLVSEHTVKAILIKWVPAAGTNVPVIQVINNVCCCFSLGITLKHFPNNCSLFWINIELSYFFLHFV